MCAMEKNPWWTNVQGPFPSWKGPVGIKEDGGGSIRGQGRVGEMRLHRAVCLRDKDGAPCLLWAAAPAVVCPWELTRLW